MPLYFDRFIPLPKTEAAYLGLLSLPMFPTLTEADQSRTIDAVFRALERGGS